MNSLLAKSSDQPADRWVRERSSLSGRVESADSIAIGFQCGGETSSVGIGDGRQEPLLDEAGEIVCECSRHFSLSLEPLLFGGSRKSLSIDGAYHQKSPLVGECQPQHARALCGATVVSEKSAMIKTSSADGGSFTASTGGGKVFSRRWQLAADKPAHCCGQCQRKLSTTPQSCVRRDFCFDRDLQRWHMLEASESLQEAGDAIDGVG